MTQMGQVHLYDTPPMDLTTDLDAFYKVRKFVAGVDLSQNFTRRPGGCPASQTALFGNPSSGDVFCCSLLITY
jgi:hypothetical protein